MIREFAHATPCYPCLFFTQKIPKKIIAMINNYYGVHLYLCPFSSGLFWIGYLLSFGISFSLHWEGVGVFSGTTVLLLVFVKKSLHAMVNRLNKICQGRDR